MKTLVTLAAGLVFLAACSNVVRIGPVKIVGDRAEANGAFFDDRFWRPLDCGGEAYEINRSAAIACVDYVPVSDPDQSVWFDYAAAFENAAADGNGMVSARMAAFRFRETALEIRRAVFDGMASGELTGGYRLDDFLANFSKAVADSPALKDDLKSRLRAYLERARDGLNSVRASENATVAPPAYWPGARLSAYAPELRRFEDAVSAGLGLNADERTALTALLAADPGLRGFLTAWTTLRRGFEGDHIRKGLFSGDAALTFDVALVPGGTAYEKLGVARPFVPHASSAGKYLLGELDYRPQKYPSLADGEFDAEMAFLNPVLGHGGRLLFSARAYAYLAQGWQPIDDRRLARSADIPITPFTDGGVALVNAFRLEPLPEVYWRIYAATESMREKCYTSFRADGLRNVKLEISATRSDMLFTALEDARNVAYGLYVLACDELGVPPADGLFDPNVAKCREMAANWCDKIREDAFLRRDVRQVDVFTDATGRRKLRIAAGLRNVPVTFTYLTPPRLRQNGKPGDPQKTYSRKTPSLVSFVIDLPGNVDHAKIRDDRLRKATDGCRTVGALRSAVMKWAAGL